MIFFVCYNVLGDNMAGTLTHAVFAEDIYNKFNKEKRNKFENYLENLKTYAQGHDILYFYFPLNLKNGKHIRSQARIFHKKNTKAFFINMINYVKENKLENNLEIMSFVYGYICHYSLDHISHPYVTYKGGIFKSKNKETYKYNSKHSEIETYIDCYMMNLKDKPKKFYRYCLNYDWIYSLYNGTTGWSISVNNSYLSANIVPPTGSYPNLLNSNNVYAVYPVFHLKSDIEYNGGDGSYNNPYKIKLNQINE